jgi:hypothetical protein
MKELRNRNASHCIYRAVTWVSFLIPWFITWIETLALRPELIGFVEDHEQCHRAKPDMERYCAAVQSNGAMMIPDAGQPVKRAEEVGK